MDTQQPDRRAHGVSQVDAASIHVWRQPDKLWRWRWVERDDSGRELTSIVSHMAFDSVSQARSSAHEAYPGVAVYVPREATSAPPRRRRRLTWVVLTVVAAVLGYRARRRRDLSTASSNTDSALLRCASTQRSPRGARVRSFVH
ncbi:MAG TPA: hypothetical protein VHG70_17630 [Nocardioidaceae bacterium]|nr:hypothetical protein [Nocardioidaceae bacterium]